MKNIHKKALPNFQNAVIPNGKLTDYALNKNNSGGRDKAIDLKPLWDILLIMQEN